MKYNVKIFFILFIWVAIPLSVWASPFKVVRIIDGDTIAVSKSGSELKIELFGVDCPEEKQPYGQAAIKFTSDMVFKKNVKIEWVGQDLNFAWVYIDGINLNAELVKNGLAWHYKMYSPNQMLSDLQNQAKENRVGLWSGPDPIEPRVFRCGQLLGHKKHLATKAKIHEQSDYKVDIRTLPVSGNDGIKLWPSSIELRLYCQDKMQSISTRDYSGVKSTFSWSPNSCGDVHLLIHFSDKTLKKVFSGACGFPEFLRLFSGGHRVYENEFNPDDRVFLKKCNIEFLEIHSQFSDDADAVMQYSLSNFTDAPNF